MEKAQQLKNNYYGLRARLVELNNLPSHLRTSEQEQIRQNLTKLLNETSLIIKVIELDEKNKNKPKPQLQPVWKEKLIKKYMPSGKEYFEAERDRNGNVVMEKVLESKKLFFREEVNEEGNTIWHVSQIQVKL